MGRDIVEAKAFTLGALPAEFRSGPRVAILRYAEPLSIGTNDALQSCGLSQAGVDHASGAEAATLGVSWNPSIARKVRGGPSISQTPNAQRLVFPELTEANSPPPQSMHMLTCGCGAAPARYADLVGRSLRDAKGGDAAPRLPPQSARH